MRGRRSHAAQCGQRTLRPVLLHEAEGHGKEHDHGDDHGFEAVSHQPRQRGRREQDDHEHVLELRREGVPGRGAFERLEFVRSVKAQAAAGVIRAEAGASGSQRAQHVGNVEGMPGGRLSGG